MAGYYFEHEDYQAETNNNSEYNDDLDYYPRTAYYETLSNNYYCNY